jgi:hypothetical protein
MSDKDYQPTKATDENGQDQGTYDSPFLAKARAEGEQIQGTTNGQWTYNPAGQ